MNPFKTLAKISNVTALKAQATRKDGVIAVFDIRPETRVTETIVSDYQSATTIRAWSYDSSNPINSLTGEKIVYFPSEGDLLKVTFEDGTIRTYRVTRDSTSSKFWIWKYTRPGYRVLFYTRYDPQ